MTIIIDNFSIGVKEWLPVTDLAYFAVDVVDHTYSVSTSGTYFLHNGQAVSTSHSGIADGYRCYYYPIDVYSSGTINITIHAENDNSETAEEEYHLLYGYNVKFDQIVDWGYNSTVVTTIEAKNLAYCPNTEGEAFYFETADLHSTDLGASIVGLKSVDLGAAIYPQSKFFFYGRTYTITISGVKDYHGNEMTEFSFDFTIENE